MQHFGQIIEQQIQERSSLEVTGPGQLADLTKMLMSRPVTC